MRLGIAVLCLLPVYGGGAGLGDLGRRSQAGGVVEASSCGRRKSRVRISMNSWLLCGPRSAIGSNRNCRRAGRSFWTAAERFDEELERDLKAAKITPDDAPEKDDDPEGAGFGYVERDGASAAGASRYGLCDGFGNHSMRRGRFGLCV